MGLISSETIEADAQRLRLSAHMIAATRAQIPMLLARFLTAYGFRAAQVTSPD
jgi:hypothetical protein